MKESVRNTRIALPSKGLLAGGCRQLLADVGLPIYSPNPRQYIAQIPKLPGVEVIFQRPGDIVISVRDGSVDFAITGKDIYLEKKGTQDKTLELHGYLGFGQCTLQVIVPDQWSDINSITDLVALQDRLDRPLKIATKFPNLSREFFRRTMDLSTEVIQAEGALEIAPTVGYADIIVDLVSTGTTLRDNRLKELAGGKILDSEACLIANRDSLLQNGAKLSIATQLLELVGAHLRGENYLAVFANIRSESPAELAGKVFSKEVIGGLQGPTISQVLSQTQDQYYAMHVVVKKNDLHQAIREIREIGGSGVVVSPVTYIFEAEPPELARLVAALEA